MKCPPFLAEKRLLRGSLEANYLQEPLREKLERLPQSDRDEFKQMAVAAICQEDKERYERNNTYYAVDFKTRMVHRWSHEQVMRQGLYIIRDNPTTDFGYIYSYALDNLGLYARSIASKGKNIYTSYYRSHEGQAQKYLDALIENAQ